jgi:tRNA (guanine37-N1)-methyltransferase
MSERAALRIDVVSLFPEMVRAALNESIPARAVERGAAQITYHDLRTWGLGKHRAVDDEPYGGGAGMLMRPEPLVAAIEALRDADSTVVLFDAGGERLRQERVRDLAARSHLIILCGRYEGVDERVRAFVDLELSIGDFVLSGGEPAAALLCDAVLRLLPGAIDAASLEEESFSSGLLEYPQYTRPSDFRGAIVPEVLTSGNHAAVAAWRARAAERRTAANRPDLLRAPSTPPVRRLGGEPPTKE